MKCPNCGTKLKDDDLFCPKCGQKVITIENKIDSENSNLEENQSVEENVNETSQEINEEIPVVKKEPFYKKLSKKTLAIIGSVIVVIIVGVVIYMNLNSDYNRFKRAFESGDQDETVEIIKEMNEEDQAKVESYLNDQIQQLHDDYYSGKITFDDLKDNISIIRNSYISGMDNSTFSTLYSEISDLHQSQQYYQNAEKYYEEQDYENAYKYYSQVIEGDSNYEDAQKKLDSFKEDYANELYTEAKSKYDSKDYEGALTSIEQAIEVNSTDEYTKLKDSINKKIAEEKAAKEEAARQALLLKNGKVINTSEAQITFNSAKITGGIYPNDTSGYYQYYTPEANNMLFFDMNFTLKNTSNDGIYVSQVSKATLKYGSSNYSSYEEFYSFPGSSDIDKVYSWDGLESLNTITYHIVFTIPSSASSDSKSITATVTIAGTTYTLEYR